MGNSNLLIGMEDPNFSKKERDIVRSKTLDEFHKEEKHEEKHEEPSMYEPYPYKDQAPNAPNYAWLNIPATVIAQRHLTFRTFETKRLLTKRATSMLVVC